MRDEFDRLMIDFSYVDGRVRKDVTAIIRRQVSLEVGRGKPAGNLVDKTVLRAEYDISQGILASKND